MTSTSRWTTNSPRGRPRSAAAPSTARVHAAHAGRAPAWAAARAAAKIRTVLLLLSPWIFGFVVFTAGPMLLSLYYSFTHYDLI